MPDDRPRDAVIGAVARDMTHTWRAWLDLHEPTDEERRIAREATILALGGLVNSEPERRDALTLTLTDLSGLSIAAAAGHALMDLFPAWPSWPSRTVGDWLKTATPEALLRAKTLLDDIDGRV